MDEREIIESKPARVICKQLFKLGRKSAARRRTNERLHLIEHPHRNLPVLQGGTLPRLPPSSTMYRRPAPKTFCVRLAPNACG
jgi:hypothetical protein